MTLGTLEAASPSLSFACPNVCLLSLIPSLQRTLFCLCSLSPGCSVAKPPTRPRFFLPPLSAHIPWEKNNSLESCGNNLTGVLLREKHSSLGKPVCPNSFVLLHKVLVKERALAARGLCGGKMVLVAGGLAGSCAWCLALTLALVCSQKLPHSPLPVQRSAAPTWELGILGSPVCASLPVASLAAGLGSGQIQATAVWMKQEDKRLLALS